MLLRSLSQTKFERGTSWRLHTCSRSHLYWLPAPYAPEPLPDYRYQRPEIPRYNLNCPSCGFYLNQTGSRFNESGNLVNVYRCSNGHVYER